MFSIQSWHEQAAVEAEEEFERMLLKVDEDNEVLRHAIYAGAVDWHRSARRTAPSEITVLQQEESRVRRAIADGFDMFTQLWLSLSKNVLAAPRVQHHHSPARARQRVTMYSPCPPSNPASAAASPIGTNFQSPSRALTTTPNTPFAAFRRGMQHLDGQSLARKSSNDTWGRELEVGLLAHKASPLNGINAVIPSPPKAPSNKKLMTNHHQRSPWEFFSCKRFLPLTFPVVDRSKEMRELVAHPPESKRELAQVEVQNVEQKAAAAAKPRNPVALQRLQQVRGDIDKSAKDVWCRTFEFEEPHHVSDLGRCLAALEEAMDGDNTETKKYSQRVQDRVAAIKGQRKQLSSGDYDQDEDCVFARNGQLYNGSFGLDIVLSACDRGEYLDALATISTEC